MKLELSLFVEHDGSCGWQMSLLLSATKSVTAKIWFVHNGMCILWEQWRS